MAKVISQNTFDDVVKENVVEFCMTTEEAKEETIKQFEAQGINLVNIIKDLAINAETGQPILNETVEKLKTHIGKSSLDTQNVLECLKIVHEECDKSLAHRVLAGKLGTHDALITLLEQELSINEEHKPNLLVLEKCLRALISLTNTQPDLFDAEALAVAIKLITHNETSKEYENIVSLTLQWLQRVCVMHEMNRQNIVNSGLILHLTPLVSKQNYNLLREVCTVFRYLVLDDDIRVEFGCAHEHARLIAGEVIVQLTQLLQEIDDANVLSDLLLTIGTLAVRQELCTTIEETGGLKSVLDIMSAHPEAVRLNREGLKLLRALAGNDAVKVHIVQQGAAPIIKEFLQTNMSNENVVIPALACVSTLTLRVKDNSIAFYETGIAEAIVESLRLNPKSKIVQRNGAWSIRNMVSRSRDQCETWLSYGVEDLLNEAMREHPTIQQDIKAALRDLGCQVELKEEWTGTAEKKIAISQK